MSRYQSFIDRKEVLVILLTITTSCINAIKQSNTSEYVLRQDLLTKQDPMVRPVLSPLDKVDVSFSAKLFSVIGVDSKKQMVTSKVWIIQKWQNPFLTWNSTKFDGLDRVRMGYKEVWVPNIKLLNNANRPSLENVNVPLYKSWVTVYSNGTNVWMSLEMFDSECDIDISNFPFDTQHCVLNFSSESYDSSLLVIHRQGVIKQTEKDLENTSGGEWDIKEAKLEVTEDIRPCCPVGFATVALSLEMKRRRTFFVLYYLLPCVILALLMFVSFIIPPESGERIGFCSSLLLALSVYLLLFSDLLPNTRNISLLGVLFVVVFLETALALLATVLVLKVYHATSEVPKVLQVLFCLKCCCSRRKERANKIKPVFSTFKKKVLPLKNNEDTTPQSNALKERNPSKELSECTGISVMGVEPDKQVSEDKEETQEQKNEEIHRAGWARIARKLDRLFFWGFFLGLAVSAFYVIFKASTVTSLIDSIQ